MTEKQQKQYLPQRKEANIKGDQRGKKFKKFKKVSKPDITLHMWIDFRSKIIDFRGKIADFWNELKSFHRSLPLSVYRTQFWWNSFSKMGSVIQIKRPGKTMVFKIPTLKIK